MNIINALKNEYVLLDGAMGTALQQKGLPLGGITELMNISNPQTVADIHRSFCECGSKIIYANTFGANRYKLPLGVSVSEVVSLAIKNARSVAGDGAAVALDIGACGKLIEPMGAMTFDEAYDIFKEVVLCGKRADLVVLETFTSLYELKAALLAVKENCDLPVICTMSFDTNRTISGTTVASMALTLEGLGANAIGFNCGTGASGMLPLVKELVKYTNLPIVVKANAGLPNGAILSVGEFCQWYKELIAAGATIIGGCCGTTPEYIAGLNTLITGKIPQKRAVVCPNAVCNESTVVDLVSIQVVGERINPTGKKLFKQALIAGDYNAVVKEAVWEKNDGAVILDVNAGLPELDEPTVLCKMIKLIQNELPLMIDTSNPIALEKALRIYNGLPIVNSVNGDKKSLETVLPLVKKYGAYVVGLTLDESGIPALASDRIKIANKIISAASSYGIPQDKVIIDALTLTVATGEYSAKECIDTVSYLTAHRIKSVLGISNVSFGLPNRDIINATFLTHAMGAGLTLAIVNPHIACIMDTVKAERILRGEKIVINRDTTAPQTSGEITLETAIIKGLSGEAIIKVNAMLASVAAEDIISDHLIKALDEVGELYASGKIFLPELIAAADAAKGVCDTLKGALAVSGIANNKGKILLATVKGDIHDIGKNIVKAVIENYGYEVIDLGKDVEIAAIVAAVTADTSIKLVGLSALMTTTATSMENSIVALRRAHYDGAIMVGGAVITAEYAAKIGADYYAKDANESVRIARLVYNN